MVLYYNIYLHIFISSLPLENVSQPQERQKEEMNSLGYWRFFREPEVELIFLQSHVTEVDESLGQMHTDVKTVSRC